MGETLLEVPDECMNTSKGDDGAPLDGDVGDVFFGVTTLVRFGEVCFGPKSLSGESTST